MPGGAPIGAALVLSAVVAGIVFGEAAGPAPATGCLIAALVGIALALWSRAPAMRATIAVFACGLLGMAVMQRALHGLAVSPLSPYVEKLSDAHIRGTLVDDPDVSNFGARMLVRLSVVADHDAGGRHVLVRATGHVGNQMQRLTAGDRVDMRGWFAPLTGSDERWRWKHAVAIVHATELLAVRHATAPLMRVANGARQLVLAGSDTLAPADRGLLGGFLVGDTRGTPPDVVEQFRAAGLSHLLVVSGENVAFVLALFAPVLRRLGLRGRFLGGAAVLLVFGTMTRWDPSVLRAISMAVLGLVAGYLGRPTTGLRLLLLAVTGLLVVDPFLVHSVGFLLSCGASLGIVLLARPITAWLPGPAWMREVLGITAAAQVGVAPVLIPVFGSMPLVALPANLCAVTLAAPLTMWGLGAGVVGGALRHVLPAAPHVLVLPTVPMLHALRAIADAASRVPIAIDGHTAWGVLAIVALVAVFARYAPKGSRNAS